jgi:Ca-activated chloride channel homolog
MNTLFLLRLMPFLLLTQVSNASPFHWQNIWQTPNQQAQALMTKGDYAKARDTFHDKAWQAAAAYRAGDYKDASALYDELKPTADNQYNKGNALAQMGQLEQAIKAYDEALMIDSSHKDARYNRDLIEKIIKKNNEQQNQNKQDQNKHDQDKQDQDKQDQDKQDQDKQDQDKQDQDKQDQDKQDQDKQDQDKQDQDKQDQDKQDQDKQDQDKQDQDKQDQDKHDQKKEASLPKTPADSQKEQERQRENEQWLRLIPDDPSGLMREKLLRDYQRLQQERH